MAELILPEETARRILNHRWSRLLLPQFYGQWIEDRQTGEVFYRAEVSDEKLEQFTEGLIRMENDR